MTKSGLWAMATVFSLVGCNLASSWEASAVRGAAGVDGGAPTSLDGGASSDLPCDVQALITAQCASCHSDPPSPGPMPLVTRAFLMMPAESDPTKTVAQVALERMQSATRPMPPTGPLAATDIAAFSAWVGAGTPAATCAADPEVDASPRAAIPECVFASDCPGSLVCRSGRCDVQCVADKDCTPTWTCVSTLCVSPDADGGASGADGGATDAAPPGPVVYGDFASASAWVSTDIVSLIAAPTYSGSAFDGRYVYFAPDNTSGKVLRYDTESLFGSNTSWSTFDLTTLHPAARGYRGAVFDGRFVYFVPKNATGIVPRLDTREAFSSGAAWTTFDLTTRGIVPGYVGATFDGRYLYLVPGHGPTSPTVRYDTLGSFTSASSWSTFDISSVNANAYAYEGAVYDGQFVYYVPWGQPNGPHGVVARYDTHSDFALPESWSTLDLKTLDPTATGYSKAAFDGRFIYLIPGYFNPAWSSSSIARYDTRGVFAASSAWTFLHSKTLNAASAGFNGATFDGRYLILSPGFVKPSYSGLASRLDTLGTFGSADAWSTFDVTSLSASAVDFRGSSTDGRYVYFAPNSGVAVRYESKSRREVPALPAYHGSFY